MDTAEVALPEPMGGSAYTVAHRCGSPPDTSRLIVAGPSFPAASFVGTRSEPHHTSKVQPALAEDASDDGSDDDGDVLITPARVFFSAEQSAGTNRFVLPPAVVLALGDLVALVTWAVREGWSGGANFYIVFAFAVLVNFAYVAVIARGQPLQLGVVKVLLGLNFPLVMFFGSALPSDVLLARLAFVAPQVVTVHLRASDLDTRWVTTPPFGKAKPQ